MLLHRFARFLHHRRKEESYKVIKVEKILTLKIKMLLLATIVLLCVSCSLGDDVFDVNVEISDEVMIVNEVEVTIKSISIIYDKIEKISSKIENGQAIDIEMNGTGDQWSYTFNTELLSGKVIVKLTQNSDTYGKIKTIECSNLKIHYFSNIWLKLFGKIIVEDFGVDGENATRKIATENFGYNNDLIMLPKITINSDYIVVKQNNRDNSLVNILPHSSSCGDSKLVGSYRQTIITNIKINESTYNIIAGKMVVFAETLGEETPIEVQYSTDGRTVKYKDNEQQTYYSESSNKNNILSN
jgi:hypothetical protein